MTGARGSTHPGRRCLFGKTASVALAEKFLEQKPAPQSREDAPWSYSAHSSRREVVSAPAVSCDWIREEGGRRMLWCRSTAESRDNVAPGVGVRCKQRGV